jgi:hypothetical protein
MERCAGVDDVSPVESKAPYIHFTKRANGVAFVPLWVTKMEDSAKRAKPERNAYYVLGAMRSDVPLKMGVKLTAEQTRHLLSERDSYDKRVKAWKDLPKEKQKNVPFPEKPADYEKDDYEKATEKNADQCGLYREKVLEKGEWLVVYWNGFIGLVNRTLTMPPDAILMVDNKKVTRKRDQPGATSLTLGTDAINLKFQVWEQPSDKKAQIVPPDTTAGNTQLWALWEALPSHFIKGGPNARPYCWDVEVAFPVASVDHPAWKSLTGAATTTGRLGDKKFDDRADAAKDAKETSPKRN